VRQGKGTQRGDQIYWIFITLPFTVYCGLVNT